MTDLEMPLKRFDELGNLMTRGEFDKMLAELAEQTATLSGANRCSILLVNRAGSSANDEAFMSVCGTYGVLPNAAFQEQVAKRQGITGHVAASGKALLVTDVRQSPFARMARHPDIGAPDLMAAPVRSANGIIGVVNVSESASGKPFDETNLRMLEVLALLIGKSVQLAQVEGILSSRFAQLALANEASSTVAKSMDAVLHNPDRVAKIMAKSFYKEMAKAGFGSKQIINAASEIITQLSSSIQRHHRRLGTDNPNDKE